MSQIELKTHLTDLERQVQRSRRSQYMFRAWIRALLGPMLHERGIEISHESLRFWWNRFRPQTRWPRTR